MEINELKILLDQISEVKNECKEIIKLIHEFNPKILGIENIDKIYDIEFDLHGVSFKEDISSLGWLNCNYFDFPIEYLTLSENDLIAILKEIKCQ